MSNRGSLPSSPRPEEPREQTSPTPLSTRLDSMRRFPIRLVDVLLYDVHITRDSERLDQQPPMGGKLTLNGIEPLFAGPRMDAMIHFRIAVPTEETPMYAIDLTLTGVFEMEQDTTQELARAFADSGVLSLLWPYAREVFENLTVRMRVPPVILPTLDIRPNSQGTETATTGDSSPIGDSAN